MSHTRILDKDWTAFCQPAVDWTWIKGLPGGRRKERKSGNENRQESDFDCEAFVDISAEMIAQFFE